MPLESNNNNNTKPIKRPFVIQLKHTANCAYQQKSASHLQAWHHTTLGVLVVTTLIKAIDKNWLTLFPELTSNGIRKHLTKSIQTTMEHLHKVRKNLRPTDKVTTEEIMEDVENDPSEDYQPPRKIENYEHIVQVTVVKFEDLKGILSSDQTGAFPNISSRGNRYIMVIEDSDAGPILAGTSSYNTRVNRQPEEDQQQHFNVDCAATRMELPIINEDEIGTIIMKN